MLAVCAVAINLHTNAAEKQKSKLVLAVYHGVRRTRKHDGSNGLWSLQAKSSRTKAVSKAHAWNSDIVNPDGSRDPASIFGEPEIGVQSELDPDYHEYQILLAKCAGIDGFMVDFAFEGQGLDDLRLIMQKTARKYDFKLGIDWYDSKCFSWIKKPAYAKYYPEGVATHEQQLKAMQQNLKYLYENLFSKPEGLNWNGHPLILLFGGGVNPGEAQSLANSVRDSKLNKPYFLRRFVPYIKIKNDFFSYPATEVTKWKWNGYIAGPFNWITPRKRKFAAGKNWDYYASFEDCIQDFKIYTNNIARLYRQKKIDLRTVCIFPGMDNRGCYGWNRDLCMIDRKDGALFRKLWQLTVNNKHNIDIVMLASWNDYTEGHQLEPAKLTGSRELITCAKYANRFKGKNIKVDKDILLLPEKLFKLRKKLKFLKNIGFDTIVFNKSLDKCGTAISKANYKKASQIINKVQKSVRNFEKSIVRENICIKYPSELLKVSKTAKGDCFDLGKGKVEFKISKKLSQKLFNRYFTCNLGFKYLDKGKQPENILLIHTSPAKAKPSYSCIASVGSNNTGKWISAKVFSYKQNMKCMDNHSSSTAFYFSGKTKIKDFSINLTFYSIKK